MIFENQLFPPNNSNDNEAVTLILPYRMSLRVAAEPVQDIWGLSNDLDVNYLMLATRNKTNWTPQPKDADYGCATTPY